jgi:hypothetical protein
MRIWGMRPGISSSLTAGDRHCLEAITGNRNAPQKQLLPPSWAQRPPRSAVPIGKGGARSMELTRRARVGLTGTVVPFRRVLLKSCPNIFRSRCTVGLGCRSARLHRLADDRRRRHPPLRSLRPRTLAAGPQFTAMLAMEHRLRGLEVGLPRRRLSERRFGQSIPGTHAGTLRLSVIRSRHLRLIACVRGRFEPPRSR